ncbi:hypothetical protein CEXT_794661 [Caerostris extrusa]|uniref:Ycf15 n=1 Tax=Caerostris extrusa TaxID=172846 RepID=A0AAV4TNA9_CAEEX|nr:hypothetical protein CEXT_794661 [Caerostris extrusa]
MALSCDYFPNSPRGRRALQLIYFRLRGAGLRSSNPLSAARKSQLSSQIRGGIPIHSQPAELGAGRPLIG